MLRESSVQIIPKPKPKVPRWVRGTFWLSLILMIVSVGLFFFLQAQVSSLDHQKQALERQLANITTSSSQKELEREISKLSEKIQDFSYILKDHKKSSKFFEFLQDSTHPKVQFVSLNLDVKNYQAHLTGKTENFKTLGEQLLILKQNKNIKGLDVSNIILDREGKVKFDLMFSFSQELIK